MGAGAVIKPLQGSGGTSVFFVSDDESPNLNQMIEAVGRDGYIVAQEVPPGGRPGRRAPVPHERRCRSSPTATTRRSGASTPPPTAAPTCESAANREPVKVDDAMLQVAEAVRPKLLADGMFLVGLDIVGDKLMEVNVFSPGGLGSCEKLYGSKFTDAVIDAARAQGRAPAPLRERARQRHPRHLVREAFPPMVPGGSSE